MAATDKLRLASNGTQAVPTSLASPMASGATTATLNVATGWPTATGVDVVMYLVDTSGNKVVGSQTSWVFQLTGTTLSGGVLKSGTMPATGYPSGSGTVVTVRPTAAWGNDVINALLGVMNQDGTLKSAPVKTALGVSSTTGGGWDILNAGSASTVSSGYNHGNKEFALTFSGVDLTAVLSAGMRLKFDRSTPAPSQCMAFTAASSQYASKSSPTGISFTSAMTTEAWVYLNSYAASAIISKTSNGQDGFGLILTASGQLQLNTGTSAGNFKNRVSYQSIPLKRWVHVAGVITQSSGAAALYINGTSVPFSSTDTGTSTSITQAGNLYIGRYADSAGGFFDGYISEARIWSTAQTATQIQDNMAVSLTGSETNLVGLWQGNSAFTDKTANANTLTPAGGAIATQTANPYNTTEYAIVTKVVYATSNTTVTVFTGTDYNIPLATLTNPFSSYQKVPFGFPSSRGKWRSDAVFRSSIAQNSPVASTWYPFWTYTIPSGEWLYGYSTPAYVVASGNISVAVTLSNTNNAESNPLISTESNINTVSQYVFTYAKQDYLSLASPTIHYLNIRQLTGTVSSIGINTNSYTTLYAECAYL